MIIQLTFFSDSTLDRQKIDQQNFVLSLKFVFILLGFITFSTNKDFPNCSWKNVYDS